MSFTVGGSTPQLTFADATVQNTAALPLTGGSVSADITVNGLTVGRGGGSVSTNTAVGASALNANTSGANNTSIGTNSGLLITTGSQNTSIGSYSGNTNLTGSYNTFVGYSSGNGNGGSHSENVGVGASSFASITTGGQNVAIGRQALALNTTASNNTAVGYQAGYGVTGASNIMVGYNAGNGPTTLSSGTNNLHIGNSTSASSASVSYEIIIGSASGSTGKGASTGYINPNSGYMYQGNNSASWAITSDQRLKKNIVDNTVGLTAINGIKVRNFEYRLPDEITDLDKSNAIAITGVQLGPIAQELQQVLPDCVQTESTGVMSVNSSDVLWHLVTAVQQLSAQVTALQTKVGV